MKTNFEGFSRSPLPQRRASAPRPEAPRSKPDRKKEEKLPKKRREKKEHMAMIEKIMAESRGRRSGGGDADMGGVKPAEKLPKKTEAGVSENSAILGIVGAALDGNLLGREGPRGAPVMSVIPHTESMEGYVGFLADMNVNAAFDSKPRPPRPTGG